MALRGAHMKKVDQKSKEIPILKVQYKVPHDITK